MTEHPCIAPPPRKHVTAKMRKAIFDKYGGRCAYCARVLTPDDKVNNVSQRFHCDHIVPLSRGGTNDLGNFNPACWKCNNWKSSFTVDEFRAVVAFTQAGAPIFSGPQRKWLREHFHKLGVFVDATAEHTFPFEHWERESTT